jgi:hypothetical protein
MMRSDELPAAPRGLPASTVQVVLVADVGHFAPVDDEGNFL